MSQSDRYATTCNSQLGKWNAEFDKMESMISKAGTASDADDDEQLAAFLSICHYKATAKPEEIQKDIVNAWKDLRQGLEKHMNCL